MILERRVGDWVVEVIEWQTMGLILSLEIKRIVKVCFMPIFLEIKKKLPNMFLRKRNI